MRQLVNVTLAIVDDEPLWLDLLRVALTSGGMHVAAAFEDPQQAVNEWPRGATVALIDIELGVGRMNGFALARELRARHRGIAVVFLTSVADPWMVDEAASSAIAGTSYLLKRGVGNLANLQRAVRLAADGQITLDQGMVEAIRGSGPMPGLTPVQVRILRLLAMGHSNAQISEEISLSVKAVESNISRIARALNVNEDQNLRVGCVTRYLAAAAPGPHGVVAEPHGERWGRQAP